jgi:hypothetical protein
MLFLNNNFFIVYIERSMVYIYIYIYIYWYIIRPLSHFDYSIFKVSLVIKIINFNIFKKMTHLAMLVIFHVNVIICQKFNLPHIHCIFPKKIHFLK